MAEVIPIKSVWRTLRPFLGGGRFAAEPEVGKASGLVEVLG